LSLRPDLIEFAFGDLQVPEGPATTILRREPPRTLPVEGLLWNGLEGVDLGPRRGFRVFTHRCASALLVESSVA